jgi:hypothetical protein
LASTLGWRFGMHWLPSLRCRCSRTRFGFRFGPSCRFELRAGFRFGFMFGVRFVVSGGG